MPGASKSGGTSMGLSQADVEAAVSAAIAAPSVLNCQPWRFRANPHEVDVIAALDYAPETLDPSSREVYLSLGAAVLNLRLGLAAQGVSAAVQFLPNPEDPKLVARLRIGGSVRLSPLEQSLYDVIPLRRSSRMPFTEEPVTYEDLMHLQDAAAVEGAHLDPATGWHRSTVVDALHDADNTQRTYPALVSEVRALTVDRERPDVGIPLDSLGPRPLDPSSVVRDMALGQEIAGRPAVEFESAALLGVLLTTGDGPIDWLRAGLALERVLLTATLRGLSVGILSHATEEVDLRQVVRDPTTGWRYPQIVLRFGYGAPMPATPRRPLTEVLEFDASE